MNVKIKISISKKWVYFLVLVSITALFYSAVVAYDNDMQLGVPSARGHSAGEIHVDYGGDTVKLQEAIMALQAKKEVLVNNVELDDQDCYNLDVMRNCGSSCLNECDDGYAVSGFYSYITLSRTSTSHGAEIKTYYNRVSSIRCCKLKVT